MSKTMPKLLKIKTKRIKCYPGDATIQVQAILENGALGIMNLTPFWCRSYKKRMYSNDRNGVCFDTISEAKEYCLENIASFI